MSTRKRTTDETPEDTMETMGTTTETDEAKARKAGEDAPTGAEVTRGDDYAYVDSTAAGIESTPDVGSSTLNPAFYPANAKPEALQTQAEKDGAEFPTA